MNTKRLISSTLAALLIAAGAYNTQAQTVASTSDVPRSISYQGILADNNGTALPDGDYQITLTLYADPTGSVPLWQDTYNTHVAGGLFNLYIGNGNTPLPDLKAMNTSLWIGTKVGNAPEMYPLTPLSASPYALNVPDRAITTGKLADKAVTADKVDMNYIAGVQINDQQIAGTGTVLKLKGSDAITLDYDATTNSVTIGAGSSVAKGSSGDAEKGAGVQDAIIGTTNWLGRTAGGGLPTFLTPYGSYNTLAGGQSNTIQASAGTSTIVGGSANTITSAVNSAFIGGGSLNTVSDFGGTIGGGSFNAVSASHGTISGGMSNTASGYIATIGGGEDNVGSSYYATIAGGRENTASNYYTTIGGGWENSASDVYATVGGGWSNTVTARSGTIGGGEKNSVESTAGTIGGGELSLINESAYGTIGGGYNHQIIGVNYGTVGGGDRNRLVGDYGTIAGGSFNILNADLGFIGGGAVNQVDAEYSTIGGGNENWARGQYSAIGGGYRNTLDGNFSAVPGGDNIKTTGYAQTATGFYNAPRGFLPSIPTTAAKATNNDPLFLVGNGTPTTVGGAPVRSNAFEVSYNGHSVVYDVNSTIRNPIVGATYVDNIIYAWGDINSGGGISSDFGVVSVTHTPLTGVYNVRIDVRDPITGAPIILTSGSVTATLTELDESTPCAFIHASRIGAYGPNQFRIRIRDASCQPLDAHFMFKVTGRP